jgi:CubicO group peptidase (beta-lactamase class C family)
MLPLLLLALAAEPSSEIKEALQPFVDRGELAGAVALVSDREKTLSVTTVGFAHIASKKAMTPDTMFWIASQSKPITATALMILVDEGKVKLDDPVSKYLPEFKDLKLAVKTDKGTTLRTPKNVMTIRHMLSHTSGMPFKSDKEAPTLDGLTLKDAVASYAATPLLNEPGTTFLYANTGINAAGRIIEVVSGMPYEVFLQKRLFDPLGMKETTFWPDKDQLARLAHAYRPNKAEPGLEEIKISSLRYPLDDRTRRPMPGGGLFSTAEDVATFCRMVMNGGTKGMTRHLSESSVKEMTTKQTGKLPNGYGLGWTSGPTFGHGGALATNMTIDPKSGLITVWLVQHQGFPKGGEKAHGAFVAAAKKKYGK